MKTLKYSRQRESIKANLMSRRDHPTADALYASIREEFPNISLGTVYRNLNFLVEHDEALRLDCGDGFDHFDGNTHPHNHFFCKSCGRIIDLKMDKIDHIDLIAAAGFDGRIDDHIIYFRGICKDCLEK